MSDYIMPLVMTTASLEKMLLHLAIELDLPKLTSHADSWEGMTASPPGDPNTVLWLESTKIQGSHKWKVGFGCLNPDDLARVEADPEMQRRWVETWQAAAPLLADVERVINNVGHLREPVTLSDAVAHMANAPHFGHSWADVFLDSTGVLASYVGGWVRDWCSVRRRWDEGRFEMLQPRQPSVWHLFYMAATAMRAACGKKELELQGATNVAARGGASWILSGATSDEGET
jgi:hypothetical protein